MIRLGLNTSGVRQGFYTKTGACISAEPNQVVNIGIANTHPSAFEEVPNFINLAKKRNEKGFYIQRTFALGDTLMAVPVVRYCEKLGWDVRMRASQTFLRMLSLLGVKCEGTMSPVRDLGILMDWIVEQDIGNPELGPLHRVEIYLKALGLALPDPKELDWSCKIEDFPRAHVTTEPFVVFQGQGANKRKQLPKETIERILSSLSDRGVTVYYIGEPRELDVTSPRVFITGRRFHFLELFPLIAEAKCLVSVDSGPLWISHFTTTPTVTVLGPSDEKQRLSLHPLYPEGTLPIMMNEWVGCQSCWEGAQACQGEIRCLQVNGERLVNEVTNRVMRFWEV